MRVAAARSLRRRAHRRAIEPVAASWAAQSVGAANAWLVLLSTRPPEWQDPLFEWQDSPPTLGDPHANLFYPDRLGYWTEVRRWAALLVRAAWPDAHVQEALSAVAVLHAREPSATRATIAAARPHVLLALDDGAIDLLPTTHVADRHEVTIRDPHRPRQTYAGWWTTTHDGVVVGKSPQHPAAHKFYKRAGLDAFLAAAPLA